MPRRKKEEATKKAEEKKTTRKVRKKDTKVDQKTVITAIVAFLIGLGIGAVLFQSQPAAAMATPDVISKNVSNWLTAYFKSQGIDANVNIGKVELNNGIYLVSATVAAGGRTLPIKAYVSPSGTLLFPQAVDLTRLPVTLEPPKTDRPKVELFVMSHCPFGVQMEKALIPVLRLLGNKVDFRLRFVNYAMHGTDEVMENLRQYCIQRNYDTQKLLDYLECLDTTGKDSYDRCMEVAGINKATVEACVQATKEEYNIDQILQNKNLWVGGRYPLFPIDDALNRKYGVQGSPTLVINGVTVKVPRTSEALKEAICKAFTSPPEECNTTLSNEAPTPGFGVGTGSSTGGQCK